MNKTGRLLAIVLELQGREVVRGEDLADLFETSVRTIYRDIQALSEASVPIIGAPGTGYPLMKGYFLPPISFTVEAILSESVRNETSRVRKALRLLTPGKRVALSKEREYFEKIRRAILDERKIRFHYLKGIGDSMCASGD